MRALVVALALACGCKKPPDCTDFADTGQRLATTTEAAVAVAQAITECKADEIDNDRMACAAAARCLRTYFGCIAGRVEVCEAPVPVATPPPQSPVPFAPVPGAAGDPQPAPAPRPAPQPIGPASTTD